MLKSVGNLRSHSKTILLHVRSQERTISTTAECMGKKNFRWFFVANKRGSRDYKKNRAADPHLFPDIPVYTEVKPTGYWYGKVYRHVPEMIPEFVVPDLTGFQLKPYVSYRAAEITEAEFSPKDLFNYVYRSKIEEDFKNGDLDENGNSVKPNEYESLTTEQAYLNARKTGSDIFSERIPRQWECLEKKPED